MQPPFTNDLVASLNNHAINALPPLGSSLGIGRLAYTLPSVVGPRAGFRIEIASRSLFEYPDGGSQKIKSTLCGAISSTSLQSPKINFASPNSSILVTFVSSLLLVQSGQYFSGVLDPIHGAPAGTIKGKSRDIWFYYVTFFRRQLSYQQKAKGLGSTASHCFRRGVTLNCSWWFSPSFFYHSIRDVHRRRFV